MTPDLTLGEMNQLAVAARMHSLLSAALKETTSLGAYTRSGYSDIVRLSEEAPDQPEAVLGWLIEAARRRSQRSLERYSPFRMDAGTDLIKSAYTIRRIGSMPGLPPGTLDRLLGDE